MDYFTRKTLAEGKKRLRFNLVQPNIEVGFTGGSVGKESACNAGDPGSITGSGRSPGEGHGNLLQYSCLENSMDRGTWWAIWGLKELDTTEQPIHTHT